MKQTGTSQPSVPLDKTSSRYGIKISVEKTKLMSSSARPITTNIPISGKELRVVDHFKYLGAIISIKKRFKSAILASASQTVV